MAGQLPDQPTSSDITEGSEEVVKVPSWRRRLLILGLIGLALAGGWVASVWYRGAPHRQLEINPETTVITEPLTPDGRVDYVRALDELMSEDVTAETNAVVPLVCAFGRPRVISRREAVSFFERLGIECMPENGEYFVDIEEFLDGTTAESPKDGVTLEEIRGNLEAAMSRPWRPGEFPLIDDWLASNEGPLKLVVEASHRSEYYQPVLVRYRPYLMDAALPAAASIRTASRALITRAMRDMAAGKLDSAWSDILTVYRLSALLQKSPITVDGMIAASLEIWAFDAVVAVLNSPDLDQQRARKYLADFETFPDPPNPAFRMDTVERFALLDFMQTTIDGIIDRQPPEGLSKQFWHRYLNTKVNWNYIARRESDLIDRVVAAIKTLAVKDCRAALAKLDQEIRVEFGGEAPLPESKGEVFREEATRLMHYAQMRMMPDIHFARDAWDRELAQRNLIRAAFALRLAQLQTGRFPERLEELPLADDVASDRFSGGPLRYEADEDGFLLYSVGQNMQEDGGTGYEDEDESTDDLSVSIRLDETE